MNMATATGWWTSWPTWPPRSKKPWTAQPQRAREALDAEESLSQLGPPRAAPISIPDPIITGGPRDLPTLLKTINKVPLHPSSCFNAVLGGGGEEGSIPLLCTLSLLALTSSWVPEVQGYILTKSQPRVPVPDT